MSTREPRIGLSQTSLFFTLPLESDVANIVSIRNLEESKVAFKIRTSTKNRYTVKPTMRVLHPKEECHVRFTFVHASIAATGSTPGEETRDRFTVEAVFADGDDASAIFAASAAARSPSVAGSASPAAAASGITKVSLQCCFTPRSALPNSMVVEQRNFGGRPDKAKEPQTPPQAKDPQTPPIPPSPATPVGSPSTARAVVSRGSSAAAGTATTVSAAAASAAASAAATGGTTAAKQLSAAVRGAATTIPETVLEATMPPPPSRQEPSQTRQEPSPRLPSTNCEVSPSMEVEQAPAAVLEVPNSYMMRLLLLRIPLFCAAFLVVLSFICPFIEDESGKLF